MVCLLTSEYGTKEYGIGWTVRSKPNEQRVLTGLNTPTLCSETDCFALLYQQLEKKNSNGHTISKICPVPNCLEKPQLYLSTHVKRFYLKITEAHRHIPCKRGQKVFKGESFHPVQRWQEGDKTIVTHF